ncbi:hypothetical protein TSUD_127420 [Trifolium subterraneum]|nr:hypothetical protein TSUD_127420 [Trifolium subterraneum]
MKEIGVEDSWWSSFSPPSFLSWFSARVGVCCADDFSGGRYDTGGVFSALVLSHGCVSGGGYDTWIQSNDYLSKRFP